MSKCEICKREDLKNESDLALHFRGCRKLNSDLRKQILNLYFQQFSIRKISKIVKTNKNTISEFLTGLKRTQSETIKIAHKNNPESFKQNSKSKQKIREKRLQYLKSHPFDNAWRRNNKNQSFIEKIFEQLIIKNKLYERFDIIREYSFYPYYLDFAFINIKLDVEIDGSQHWRNPIQKKRDLEKDKKLINKGWKVFRIPEFKLRCELESVEKEFLNFLQTFEDQPKLYNFSESIIHFEQIRNLKQQQVEEKRKEKNKTREKLRQHKIQILKRIDFTKRGWIKEACKALNLSHTQVRRFLRLVIPDLDKQTYFKPRLNTTQRYLNMDWNEYYKGV